MRLRAANIDPKLSNLNNSQHHNMLDTLERRAGFRTNNNQISARYWGDSSS